MPSPFQQRAGLGFSTAHINSIYGGFDENGMAITLFGTDVDGGRVPLHQDATYGRDLTDGFDFKKLNTSGNPAADNDPIFACIEDNVEGLVWQVKSIEDSTDQYSWYSNNINENAGVAGTQEVAELSCDATYDPRYPNDFCNSQAYIDRINAAGLCGSNDWRLPTADELISLMDFSAAGSHVDGQFFTDVTAGDMSFLTSNTSIADTSKVKVVNFTTGNVEDQPKADAGYIRLVRESNTAP